MKTDNHQAQYIPFRCSAEMAEAIAKLSVQQSKTKSEILRQLVEAGLVATGYKRDEEYLTKQIQEAAKAAFQPSVERLAAISAKAAQISGASFFMGIYMSRLLSPPGEQDLIDQAAAQARKLGIDYLKLKDKDVDTFMEGGVKRITGKE